MINGNVYDFESIKLELPTGMSVMLESISYKDKKEDEIVTGVNGLPLGIGRGDYSGDCDLEISRFEYDQLDTYAANSGGFFNLPPVPIVISYGHADQIPVTDSILVKFTEREFGGSKGDKNLKVKIKGLLAAPIVSGGRPAYTPN